MNIYFIPQKCFYIYDIHILNDFDIKIKNIRAIKTTSDKRPSLYYYRYIFVLG